MKCDKEGQEREVACGQATEPLTIRPRPPVNSVDGSPNQCFSNNRFSVRNQIGEWKLPKYW